MEFEPIPMEELYPLLELQMAHGGKADLVVTGFSMYPTLRHKRDRVELQPLPDTLKKGDIILYKRENGRFILHRIVKIYGNRLICCGDNQWELEPIDKSQALAIVTKLYRKGKAIAVDCPTYKSISNLWIAALPVRKVFIQTRKKCGRFLRRKLSE